MGSKSTSRSTISSVPQSNLRFLKPEYAANLFAETIITSQQNLDQTHSEVHFYEFDLLTPAKILQFYVTADNGQTVRGDHIRKKHPSLTDSARQAAHAGGGNGGGTEMSAWQQSVENRLTGHVQVGVAVALAILAGIGGSYLALSGDIGGLDARVNKTNERIEALDKTVAVGFQRLDARADAADAQMDRMETKVDRIESKLDQVIERLPPPKK